MRRRLLHLVFGILAAIVVTLSPLGPAAFADGGPGGTEPPPDNHIPIDVPWGG